MIDETADPKVADQLLVALRAAGSRGLSRMEQYKAGRYEGLGERTVRADLDAAAARLTELGLVESFTDAPRGHKRRMLRWVGPGVSEPPESGAVNLAAEVFAPSLCPECEGAPKQPGFRMCAGCEGFEDGYVLGQLDALSGRTSTRRWKYRRWN
jgi:hypothetical protein